MYVNYIFMCPIYYVGLPNIMSHRLLSKVSLTDGAREDVLTLTGGE